jgi:hypothetical protein
VTTIKLEKNPIFGQITLPTVRGQKKTLLLPTVRNYYHHQFQTAKRNANKHSSTMNNGKKL